MWSVYWLLELGWRVFFLRNPVQRGKFNTFSVVLLRANLINLINLINIGKGALAPKTLNFEMCVFQNLLREDRFVQRQTQLRLRNLQVK